MKKKYIFVAVMLLFGTVSSFAQEANEKGSFSMHAGLSLPMDDFGDDDIDDEDSGLAGTGINIGIEYVYKLNENSLGLFVGLDLFRNGINGDSKDDLEDELENLIGSQVDIEFPVYYNIPISAGLVYNYKVDEKIALFAKGGLVFNSLITTDMSLKLSGEEIVVENDLATSFGFKFGTGVTFSENWSIEIDYLGLGEHDIDSESKCCGETENSSSDLKVGIVSVTLGYKF